VRRQTHKAVTANRFCLTVSRTHESLYKVTLRAQGGRNRHAQEKEGEALVLTSDIRKAARSVGRREEAMLGLPED